MDRLIYKSPVPGQINKKVSLEKGKALLDAEWFWGKGGYGMDELFFKQLMFAGEGDENLNKLIEMGYFKMIDGSVCRTNKFLEETGRFIDDKKESLYQVVKELGSAENIEEVMDKAGIKDFITFVFVAEELVGEGRLVKDKVKNVVLKQ